MEITSKRIDNSVLELVYCKTHKIMCSKSGWELGWYLGTRSIDLMFKNKAICLMCKKEFYCRTSSQKYCKTCSKVRHNIIKRNGNQVILIQKLKEIYGNSLNLRSKTDQYGEKYVLLKDLIKKI